MPLKEYEVPTAPAPQEQVSKEPSMEELLAQHQKEQERLRAELAARDAAQDARLDEVRRLAERRHEPPQAEQPPQQQVDVNAIKAYMDQAGITDEQILSAPRDVLADLTWRASQAIAQQEVSSLRSEVGRVFEDLAHSRFKSELGSLAAEPFFADVQKELEAWVDKNPNERFREGAVRAKYNELVGATRPWEKKQEETLADRSVTRQREVETPIATSPAMPSRTADSPSVSLDEARQEVMDVFNQLAPKYAMDAAEFQQIEDGKKFPKRKVGNIEAARAAGTGTVTG